MKKIFCWGCVAFLLAGVLWVISVIVAVMTLGTWSTAANILGYTTIAVLPFTLLLALIKKLRN